ncbi:hypothetical protein BELL_0092g00190 [Botrytis elliptica]|uniref:Uncharacterized protein n=1 Tax=Botrytis elliptica TaxID=278938 RepID=A0A4Z1JV68_9HELO|nr:hypothetical protein EAE99_002417 [Botrytis elliptica]TGO77769.1 hypothetical protein BELL_0092g00190 [Botrytis elliptica]
MRSQHKSLVLRIPLPRWTNFNRPRLPRFHHLSKYPDPGEPAKFVFDNRCKLITLDLVLLALPLATTASLVYLNVQSVYWGDTQANGTWQNTMLNSLQFAAKLHELWIGSSVAYMVSHFIVFMLAKAKGIPFGLLGAGLQIGDLRFFTRTSFWSSFECSHGRKLSIYLFALFVVFCSILTALAGPSSAIAMRPNLDWWQMTNNTLVFRFPTKLELWPINLLEPLAPPLSMVNCSNYVDASANFVCPASGAQDINTWLNSQDFNVLKGKAANMTFYNAYTNTRNFLASAGMDSGHSYTTSLSVVPQLAVGAIWNDLTLAEAYESFISQPKFLSHSTTTLKQPIVQVKCNIYAQSNLTSAGKYTADAPVFPLLHGIMKNTSAGTASIGGIFMLPISTRVYNGTGWSTVQDTLIIPCTFDARWLQTQVKYEPTTSDIINDNLTDSVAFSELRSLINNAHQGRTKKKRSEFSDVINTTPSWAAYTNIVVPGVHLTQNLTQDLTVSHINGTMPQTNRVQAPTINFNGDMHANPTFPAPAPAQNLPNATLIQGLLNRFMILGANGTLSFNQSPIGGPSPPSSTANIQGFISLYAGVFMTDALARYGSQSVISDDNFSFGHNDTLRRLASLRNERELPKGWLEWKFEIWRRGYSYGIRGITTKLALAPLLTHCISTLGFMVYLCFAGWRTVAWNSIGEFIALALKSRSTETFRGTDAGIDLSTTWAQNIRIGKIGTEELEIRFGEDGCEEEKGEWLGVVRVGRRYGGRRVWKRGCGTSSIDEE